MRTVDTQSRVPVVLSMLHEPADRNSATRQFRADSVLHWTTQRLRLAERVADVLVICWDDQLAAVTKSLGTECETHSIGPRRAIASVDGVTAARKWADGWRGGLLQTCAFDAGFHGPTLAAILEERNWSAVLLVDPSAGLVDPNLIDALVAHADAQPGHDLIFSAAAPGLCGVLLRRPLMTTLAAGNLHPGRALHYVPTHPILDPLGRDACVPTPTPLARTTHRFTLDSDRQIDRLSQATQALNGQLIGTGSLRVLEMLNAHVAKENLPREVSVELTTRRETRPIYGPVTHIKLDRPDLSVELTTDLFKELGTTDDVRLIFAGVGDPLLAPEFFNIVDRAIECGIRSICIETDFYGVPADVIDRLAIAPIDVVTVHIPALSPATYVAVMGVDGLTQVVENVRRFLQARQSAGRSSPLLVPTFTKMRENLAEMESWYDQWLNALGHAVIVGPSDYAAQIPDLAVSDVSPPRRKACARIEKRLTVLSDGRVVSCEQDVSGVQHVGRVGEASIESMWTNEMEKMRQNHACGAWDKHALCRSCREWHRP